MISRAAISKTVLSRHGAVGALALGLAGTLSLATVTNPRIAEAIGNGVDQTVQGAKTVAAMLAERSPGERPEGALASLKPKRETMLHERALPKVRAPSPSAYEALAAPPPTPPIVPSAEAPIFNTVAGTPVPITPVPGGGTANGPVLSGPIGGGGGGGGGGGFTPPIITTATPETPQTPVPAVPEPATWAMMLLGFAMVGRALRQGKRAGLKTAVE